MFFEKNYTLYKRNNGSYARHCVYCIIYTGWPVNPQTKDVFFCLK